MWYNRIVQSYNKIPVQKIFARGWDAQKSFCFVGSGYNNDSNNNSNNNNNGSNHTTATNK